MQLYGYGLLTIILQEILDIVQEFQNRKKLDLQHKMIGCLMGYNLYLSQHRLIRWLHLG